MMKFVTDLTSKAGAAISLVLDNGNIFIRSTLPFFIIMALNILLTKIGIAGIAVAVVLDILAGIYIYRQNVDRENIISTLSNIRSGENGKRADVRRYHAENKKLAKAVNEIGDGINEAVSINMKNEKLKADLITNVSHDLKTPLTSIINYVDLLKREDIPGQRAQEYLNILTVKSNKLKELTEDLLEVSKITSGNINISLAKINFVELINQTIGEFYDKFEKCDLEPYFYYESGTIEIMADPRQLWRVVENIINNVCKYAMTGTRVHMGLGCITDKESGKKIAVFSIKNISTNELNLDETLLTERFMRGDVSRTTEGTGLGLSIAKNLTEAMGGRFSIRVDGDLFTVSLKFEVAQS
jgi:signal transduction histidine kinase